MNLTIRRISESEWKVYKNLRLEALRLAPEAFSSKYSDNIIIADEEWKKRVSKYATDINACNLIAWKDDLALGMVTYINEEQPSMYQMWVNPSFRKLGIAEKLVSTLQEWLKDSGQKTLICSVYKNNFAALNLYLRLGFYQTHEDDKEFHLKWEG
jgi:ribosomal protein S18 acetylase RimI-like enzyme